MTDVPATYGVELDQKDLGELEQEEETNDDQEVPPPLIGNFDAVACRDIRRAGDHSASWRRAKQGTHLVRSEPGTMHSMIHVSREICDRQQLHLRIFCNIAAITGNDVGTITQQL